MLNGKLIFQRIKRRKGIFLFNLAYVYNLIKHCIANVLCEVQNVRCLLNAQLGETRVLRLEDHRNWRLFHLER